MDLNNKAALIVIRAALLLFRACFTIGNKLYLFNKKA